MVEAKKSVISINDLRIEVNIGVTEEERKEKQDIGVSLKFISKKLPEGCFTDNIEDTICYHACVMAVLKLCDGNEFKLLEHLSMRIYKVMREIVSGDTGIWIKVDKYNPPIENIIGSTSFEFSDIEV